MVTSVAFAAKNSIFVAVNDVAETTFVPLAKTSAVLPFHLIAILVVSVVVVCNAVNVPLTLLLIANLGEPPPLFLIVNSFELLPLVELSPNQKLPVPSLVYARLFLNSKNHVPPLELMRLLVKILLVEKVSAKRVTETVLVGMNVVANAPNSNCGDAILTVKSYELPTVNVILNELFIRAVDAFVLVLVNA